MKKKGKVAIYEFTKPVQVILNASKIFKNPVTKKEVTNELANSIEYL